MKIYRIQQRGTEKYLTGASSWNSRGKIWSAKGYVKSHVKNRTSFTLREYIIWEIDLDLLVKRNITQELIT